MEKLYNTLNNKNLFYKGNGRDAVILIHGYTGSVDNLDIFFNFFKKNDLTVARPSLSGHHIDKDNIYKYGPADWEKEVGDLVDYLSREYENIHLIGLSFGGNLAYNIASKKNIAKIITLETPFRFVLRMEAILQILQRIYEFLGIEWVKKGKFTFRKHYDESLANEVAINAFPVRTSGLVRDYIQKSKKILPNINIPNLIMCAFQSDLLHENNLDYVFERIGSDRKEKFIIPIDNHDLDLLDQANKEIVLSRIWRFINEN